MFTYRMSSSNKKRGVPVRQNLIINPNITIVYCAPPGIRISLQSGSLKYPPPLADHIFSRIVHFLHKQLVSKNRAIQNQNWRRLADVQKLFFLERSGCSTINPKNRRMTTFSSRPKKERFLINLTILLDDDIMSYEML